MLYSPHSALNWENVVICWGYNDNKTGLCEFLKAGQSNNSNISEYCLSTDKKVEPLSQEPSTSKVSLTKRLIKCPVSFKTLDDPNQDLIKIEQKTLGINDSKTKWVKWND